MIGYILAVLYVRQSIVWNAGVTLGQVCMRHPLAPALRCETSDFPKLIMSPTIIKATFSATKNPYFTCIFGGEKIYRSWMTGKRWYLPVKLYIFAGQWPAIISRLAQNLNSSPNLGNQQVVFWRWFPMWPSYMYMYFWDMIHVHVCEYYSVMIFPTSS